MKISYILDMPRIIIAYFFIHMATSSFWPRHTTSSSQGDVTYTLIDASSDDTSYGLDITYPIHGLLKNTFFRRRYDDMMHGCYLLYSMAECQANDRSRIDMNRDQPKTQHNYTDTGFKKVRAPQDVYEMILASYRSRQGQERVERWPRANTYSNHWEASSSVLSLQNKMFRGNNIQGRGYTGDIMQRIWDGTRPVMEQWIGKTLVETGLYGVRVYHDGAILATHVDRLPLVSSAIIQVDQDVDEPWPVEVYGRDGKAYNITLEPGDMLMYESHSILHGRPFPLRGRFYASVDVHFSPVDHDKDNMNMMVGDASRIQGPGQPIIVDKVAAKKLAIEEAKNRVGGHEHDNNPTFLYEHHLYHLLLQELTPDPSSNIIADHPINEEENIEIIEMNALNEAMKRPPRGRTDLHVAAARGNYDKCVKLVSSRASSIIHMRDEHGWQAIHEAARGGYLEVVQLLVHHGADVSAATLSGQTPLWWARRALYPGHEVIRYLESLNADEGEDEVGFDEHQHHDNPGDHQRRLDEDKEYDDVWRHSV